MIKLLRITAILEGLSYISLGLTMYLKYQMDMPKPNYIVGMMHGFLFILYVVLCLAVYIKLKLKFKWLFWAGLASIVPIGTFIADKKLFKNLA